MGNGDFLSVAGDFPLTTEYTRGYRDGVQNALDILYDELLLAGVRFDEGLSYQEINAIKRVLGRVNKLPR